MSSSEFELWSDIKTPPEPPDLKSPVEELFTMRTPTGHNVIDEAKKENGANRGAEDGAVSKGNVEDDMAEPNSNNGMDGYEDVKPKTKIGVAATVEDRVARVALESKVGSDDKAADLNSDGQADAVDNGTRSSVEVGSSMRGICTSMTVDGGTRPRAVVVGGECTTSTSRGAEGGAVATMTEGGLVTRFLRRLIFLTPPPILAAILPWDYEIWVDPDKNQHRVSITAQVILLMTSWMKELAAVVNRGEWLTEGRRCRLPPLVMLLLSAMMNPCWRRKTSLGVAIVKGGTNEAVT
ncbi:hypothetical protein PIB30_038796 [Stylosanthes scabra]|uniref:Uncharacterized protein n=1 Tax=Stylosanthes scabra TaxID=79078 RepID=A0ABU6ZCU0_9FABA|nr:hypothetical protein [Stylosanthes scabra]